MRIIAGTYRSRPLQAPAGMTTRPTSDRLRETLFNVLAPRIEAARFLDLYAGSGAVGLEALSRGAAHVVFVERAPEALKALRSNLDKLGVTRAFDLQACSVREFLRRAANGPRGFDLVFLDPPYDAETEYEGTLRALGGADSFPRSQARDLGHPDSQLLAAGAVVIAEHRRKMRLEDAYGSLQRTRLLEQGDAALSFYAARDAAPSR
jgi:16S rRNA (guanine966-N2)-methyltransferase